MKSARWFVVAVGLIPLAAMAEETRDSSETGLPSMAADPAREEIRAHNQRAAEADRPIEVTRPLRVYGAELMTEVERADYRARILNATTPAERERIRARHHDEMQARARERGVALPERPRPYGDGIGVEADRNALEEAPGSP